jgi:uroporphyrin-III C-methyltransferase
MGKEEPKRNYLHHKVTLIGAGPGDPELISVKGMRVIGEADAVLYDALIHLGLLEYAQKEAIRVFVGKRSGKPGLEQQEINQLLLKLHGKYKHVVRLKGGDPYIFGRGFEEFLFLRSNGVYVQYIPGLSSATALAGLVDIPLTHREVSRSFHVITASADAGRFTSELSDFIKLSGTRVILMGLRYLDRIIELCKESGQEDIPVAVISQGSLETQKSLISTVKEIGYLPDRHTISSPAIIILGETVNLYSKALFEGYYGS